MTTVVYGYEASEEFDIPDLTDDKLQDLHHKLKDMPSYMYLSNAEQELEAIAFAYLENFPFGTRAQLQEVKHTQVWDPEDRKKRDKLQSKIKKVLDARNGDNSGFKGVLQRVSELQDLQSQKEQINLTIETLEWVRPHYGNLLTLRYIAKEPVDDVAREIGISRKTYDRWSPKAIMEYAKLSGLKRCNKEFFRDWSYLNGILELLTKFKNSFIFL